MDGNQVMTVQVVVAESASMPLYATDQASGADLCAWLPDRTITLAEHGGQALIPTGLVLEIPCGYEGQVRPRSGLAAKHGVTVLNSPGTIDSDYRGEVKVILINHGSQPFTISHGQRIAQLVLAPVSQGRFIEVETITETDRGNRGFGSTGV